ncbi:hypothetical protein CDAR_453651 [Caerostris darwini]|uniref:Uncharacterized protein n=1 Tax=Caerostris darwini TaxID=1538125 RepID=A0AAV4NXM8_9ARAC|nr:hypothetical protein CDAR_453651 [Caerostris darwini]
MVIINTSSVMSSKIEDHLGSLVESTTHLAEASSLPVEPRTYSNQTSNDGILTPSNNSVPLEEKNINLNVLCVAGEDHIDLSETFKSTSFDSDQLSPWSNFRSHLTKTIETPVKESPIQMAIMNNSSVMSSKIEDDLGRLVETTTRLAEASSVPVEPRTY